MAKLRKCVVWDLDNTLWDGICVEGDVIVREEIQRTIERLDGRGIINSIASRGVYEAAIDTLDRYRLSEYFVFPRINWLPKPTNIVAIAKDIGIGLDSIVFVDDDGFELEQAAYMLPEIMTVSADKASNLILLPDFNAGEITAESRSRRSFYQAEEKRRHAENCYPSRLSFLEACEMRLKVRPMTRVDIDRVLELMTRTSQLNMTGQILPRDTLLDIFKGKYEDREVFVCDLTDKFGSYGVIGSALLQMQAVGPFIEHLAISCRIMGRGVERAFIYALVNNVHTNDGDNVLAAYRNTGNNREMLALFQMMGFKGTGRREDGALLLLKERRDEFAPPSWVKVI